VRVARNASKRLSAALSRNTRAAATGPAKPLISTAPRSLIVEQPAGQPPRARPDHHGSRRGQRLQPCREVRRLADHRLLLRCPLADQGDVLLAIGDPAAAEASYNEAIAVAQSQSARLWELGAAMSLARLWRDQGKGTEAHALLAPVYGWFTEGFGTPVLQEAKALLNDLD
jgi:hypothetical protein